MVLGILVLVSLIFNQVNYSLASFRAKKIAEHIDTHKKIDFKTIDPWGSEFKVEDIRDEIWVRSAGPDRIINTSDDIITYRRKQKK